jgi:hypothetical protein
MVNRKGITSPRATIIAAGIGVLGALGVALISNVVNANSRPIPSLMVVVEDPDRPMALTIDTSGSIDPDGDAITVSVFIDNMRQPGNEPRRTVVVPRPGPVLIRVDVSDGKLTASADQRVVVP